MLERVRPVLLIGDGEDGSCVTGDEEDFSLRFEGAPADSPQWSGAKRWTLSRAGTVRCDGEDFKVSPETGLVCDGRVYRLADNDVQYTADVPLGHGNSGEVWPGVLLQRRASGLSAPGISRPPVAIKVVRVEAPSAKEQLLNEIRGLILAQECPNLLKLYGGFVSRGTGAVHIVMELMDLGSLQDLQMQLNGQGAPEDKLACIGVQVFKGLVHLHDKCRVIHRDVKPANILINSQGAVKLSDFGISKALRSPVTKLPGYAPKTGTPAGTRLYMSPERCSCEEYSFECDIWSVGVVLHEMATGSHPYAGAKNAISLYELLCCTPPPQLDDRFAPEFVEVIGLCMSEASRRPGAAELLSHSFFVGALSWQADLGRWFFSWQVAAEMCCQAAKSS